MPTQTILIQAKFGSDLQRDVGLRTLQLLLDAWKAQIEATHQKSEIEITFDPYGRSKEPVAAS